MTAPAPTDPLDVGVPVPPDRDWQVLRDAALAAVAVTAPEWTDHNPSDPGVTITEAVAWGLADLHYRTSSAPLDGWSAQTALWREPADRHWSGAPLPSDHARLLALAAAVATVPPAAAVAVRLAVTATEATGLLLAADVPVDLTAAATRLLRAPLVLRAAMDGAAAVEAVTDRSEACALPALRVDPLFDRLWDDELRAVLRRARQRSAAREVRRRTDELRRLVERAPSHEAPHRLGQALGVDAEQAVDALGVHPAPTAAVPETWETADGWTTHWPPHPLQARTVEPVTAGDYARLARSVAGVRRAWTVAEVLPGLGWDGAEVTARATRPGAVTLLVEADPVPEGSARRALLQQVLRAVGDEVDDPWTPVHTDLGSGGPRRTMCDEVGAALLERCPVTLRGVLHVAVTADREDVLAAALARVAALFGTGRPESATTAGAAPVWPRDLEGPWPVAPPEPGGWVPGEAVRVPELVQRLSDDVEVLGVEALEARAGDGAWQPYALPLDPSCTPVLADDQCLRVRFDLVEGCGGAC